jgi:hypothetical protein
LDGRVHGEALMLLDSYFEGSSALAPRGRISDRRAESRRFTKRQFMAELAPARVRGDHAERVELQLRITSHFGTSTRARWAVEVIGDDDAPAAASTLEAPVVIGGFGGTHTAPIAIPARIADGFYMVRVTAVARGGETFDAVVLERYVEVRDGGVVAIDSDDHDTRPYVQLVV